ncbi:MAG: hypothetical protein AAF799_09945 [Myxococcota bacterium]
MPDLALTTVSTEHLRTLLRAVFKKQIECPLTVASLAAMGLQDTSGPLLSHLRGLDQTAVHAVLVAVLAERDIDDATRAKRQLGIV